MKDWKESRAKIPNAWIGSIARFDWDSIDADTLDKIASYAQHEDLKHENIVNKSNAAAYLA